MVITDAKEEPHPGWAIKLDNGYWLGRGHGYCSMPASLACTFSSEEEARRCVIEEDLLDCQVVVAWEPLVASLRSEIKDLTMANKINPDRLYNLRMSLSELSADIESFEVEFKSLLSE